MENLTFPSQDAGNAVGSRPLFCSLESCGTLGENSNLGRPRWG